MGASAPSFTAVVKAPGLDLDRSVLLLAGSRSSDPAVAAVIIFLAGCVTLGLILGVVAALVRVAL